MRLHEAFARETELPRIAGFKESVDRISGETAAKHGVIDTLARRRRDDSGRVAGKHDVASIVPALQWL